MSSLMWSFGRYNNVSLASPCAIPSSDSSSQQNFSRRNLCCYCTLPAFSDSGITHTSVAGAPESQTELERRSRLLESVYSNDDVNSDYGGEDFQQRSVLQSVLSVVVAFAMTIGIQGAPSSRDTFEDVPQTLSGEDKRHRIQKPNSAKAETCTSKCVSTCIRGGAGAPGEGPLNVRRPLVVFKEGFRSRNYCLVECSEICNLIGDGDDGP